MLSAVVLTRNEEKNLVDCIESLSFCDEVVVIDDNSEDRTLEIAKKLKAKVFSRLLNGDFASQRNFGLEKAKGEWVLFIDADERVTPSLRDEISKLVAGAITQLTNHPITQYDGFYIKRSDFMWGRELKHGETGSMRLLRLARIGGGRWEGKVHEVWNVKGAVGQLQQPLLHYPHQSIASFLEEINLYTDIRAKELYQKGVRVHWWSVILYPKAKFFLNYILKMGFLDGLPGLIFAILMSFHSFLVRGKLWLLWQRRQ